MKFAVIFDMDGVLVDSNKLVLDSFNKLLEPHGISIDENKFKEYLGITAKGLVEKWKREHNVVFDENFIKDQTTNLHVASLKDNRIDVHLFRFLTELKENKIPVGLGTSSPRKRAEQILDILGVRKFFSSIVTGDEVQEHKPNPEIFLKVAKELKTPPESCVVIEDAANGIEAAKRGGMKAIGYLTNYHTKEELKKADFILDNFSELNLEKVKKLFN